MGISYKTAFIILFMGLVVMATVQFVFAESTPREDVMPWIDTTSPTGKPSAIFLCVINGELRPTAYAFDFEGEPELFSDWFYGHISSAEFIRRLAVMAQENGKGHLITREFVHATAQIYTHCVEPNLKGEFKNVKPKNPSEKSA